MRQHKRILLVNPLINAEWRVMRPPLGLGYIAENLSRRGIEYDVIDLNLGYGFKDLHHKMRCFTPDLLGLSLVSLEYKKSYALINQIKRLNPDIKIVVGGPHLTILREKVLRECQSIDYGVVSEGEQIVADLCQTDDNIEEHKGLLLRNGNEIINTGEGDYVDDLDNISFPRYERFELKKYIQEMNIYTSRGCPHHCIFCPNKMLFPHYRARSPQSVLEELQYWYERGYRHFNFDDDNFNLDKKRVHHMCDGILGKGMKDLVLRCSNGIRADFVDRHLLEHMKEAGFKYIAYGVDAANDKTLKLAKKGESMAVIESAIQETCRLGIGTKLLFVVGIPGETAEDIKDMIALVKRYPLDDVHFYNLIPYPGTELYQWIKENDCFLIEPEIYLNDVSCLRYQPLFETPELSKEEREAIFRELSEVKREITHRAIKRKLKHYPLVNGLAARIFSSNLVQENFFRNIRFRRAVENFRYRFSH